MSNKTIMIGLIALLVVAGLGFAASHHGQQAAAGVNVAGQAAGATAAAETPKELYTCLMHPKVVRDHPGSCPKCGMALVKKPVSPA